MLDYENSIFHFAAATTHCFVGQMMELHWCLDLKIVDLHYYHLYRSYYLDLKLEILIVLDLFLPTMFGIYIIMTRINSTLSHYSYGMISHLYTCVFLFGVAIPVIHKKQQSSCDVMETNRFFSHHFVSPNWRPFLKVHKTFWHNYLRFSLFTMFDSSYLESIYMYKILQNILREIIKFGNFGYLVEKSSFNDFSL